MRQHRFRSIAVAMAATVMLVMLVLASRAFATAGVLAESATTLTRSSRQAGLGEDQEKVVIAIEPDNSLASVGETFTVTVRIHAGLDPIDVAEAYVDFNPKVLQVATLVFGTALPEPAWWIENFVDNEQGHVAYGASQVWSAAGVTGTFDLVSIQFRAMRPSITTTLAFSDAEDRKTKAVSEGYALPLLMENGEVVITNPTPTPTSTLIMVPTPTPTTTPGDPFPLKLLLPLVLRVG